MTPFQELVHRLAVTAQEALYHDIDESMPEYQSGVERLVTLFTPILRGKVKSRAVPSTKPEDAADRIEQLEAELASERERCAQVADEHSVIAAEMARGGLYAGPASAAKNTGIGIAAAIRALPPTKTPTQKK